MLAAWLRKTLVVAFLILRTIPLFAQEDVELQNIYKTWRESSSLDRAKNDAQKVATKSQLKDDQKIQLNGLASIIGMIQDGLRKKVPCKKIESSILINYGDPRDKSAKPAFVKVGQKILKDVCPKL